ncbi:MAG: hypothetical protein V9G04_14825 [Nocardioides sp.]|jgi:hypothetical protein
MLDKPTEVLLVVGGDLGAGRSTLGLRGHDLRLARLSVLENG